jgi:hypothetical protein
MWLYQLNQEKWPPGLFRRDIWEGVPWHFKCGLIRKPSEGEGSLTLGDVVVFFYTEAKGQEPGIYGWAVVDRIDKVDGGGLEDRLHFIPSAPTNHLKMDPWWDKQVEEITGRIRKPLYTATLFEFGVLEVTQGTPKEIRDGIKKWLSPGK